MIIEHPFQHTYHAYLTTYLPTHLPHYLPTYLSSYLPVYLPTYLPIYLSYLSMYQNEAILIIEHDLTQTRGDMEKTSQVGNHRNLQSRQQPFMTPYIRDLPLHI